MLQKHSDSQVDLATSGSHNQADDNFVVESNKIENRIDLFNVKMFIHKIYIESSSPVTLESRKMGTSIGEVKQLLRIQVKRASEKSHVSKYMINSKLVYDNSLFTLLII
jgi:hypothetical protein